MVKEEANRSQRIAVQIRAVCKWMYGSPQRRRGRGRNDECGMMNDELRISLSVHHSSFILHHYLLRPLRLCGESYCITVHSKEIRSKKREQAPAMSCSIYGAVSFRTQGHSAIPISGWSYERDRCHVQPSYLGGRDRLVY